MRKRSGLPGRLTILSLWLVLFSADSARDQLYTGSLTGIVVDPSDSPGLGAHVTLIDSDRSIRYATKTDAFGRYLFRSLAPGNYALQVEAAGFDVFEVRSITIEVNGSAVSEVKLRVPTRLESVSVEAAAVPPQVGNATIGLTLQRMLVNDPDLTAPLKVAGTGNLNQYFGNPQVAVRPAPYSDGNAPCLLPNARIPATNNLTASLFKQVPLHFREGANCKFAWNPSTC